jgi:ATP-dependent RNA helicase DDX3X
LTRTLLETKQEVPDFLEQYKPEGEAAVNLKFEADSDFEEEDAAADDGEGGGWGGGGDEAKGDGEKAAEDEAW